MVQPQILTAGCADVCPIAISGGTGSLSYRRNWLPFIPALTFKAAAESFRSALRINSKYLNAMIGLAKTYYRSGDLVGAYRLLARAYVINPKDKWINRQMQLIESYVGL